VASYGGPQVWDTVRRHCLEVLSGHTGAITCLHCALAPSDAADEGEGSPRRCRHLHAPLYMYMFRVESPPEDAGWCVHDGTAGGCRRGRRAVRVGVGGRDVQGENDDDVITVMTAMR
jgi:hypothetical protein